ncbi:MAG: energy transducer TonB, partial [Anaerolineae bacterium]
MGEVADVEETEFPDYPTMEALSFFIKTDGRAVTAQQWPGTLAKKVQESFVAALIYDTAPVEQGASHFQWTNGSRSIKTEIRIDDYHPAGTFKARLDSQFTRGSRTTLELSRELELQMGRTSVWSSNDLEISATDYLSHFREYKDREARGLLYEQLRPYTIFLVMAVTPRVLLTHEEAGPRRTLSMPPGAEVPLLVKPSGVPLQGTILLGFSIDETGAPVNPQVLRSTLPEANLRIVEEASYTGRHHEPAIQ